MTISQTPESDEEGILFPHSAPLSLPELVPPLFLEKKNVTPLLLGARSDKILRLPLDSVHCISLFSTSSRRRTPLRIDWRVTGAATDAVLPW